MIVQKRKEGDHRSSIFFPMEVNYKLEQENSSQRALILKQHKIYPMDIWQDQIIQK